MPVQLAFRDKNYGSTVEPRAIGHAFKTSSAYGTLG